MRNSIPKKPLRPKRRVVPAVARRGSRPVISIKVQRALHVIHKVKSARQVIHIKGDPLAIWAPQPEILAYLISKGRLPSMARRLLRQLYASGKLTSYECCCRGDDSGWILTPLSSARWRGDFGESWLPTDVRRPVIELTHVYAGGGDLLDGAHCWPGARRRDLARVFPGFPVQVNMLAADPGATTPEPARGKGGTPAQYKWVDAYAHLGTLKPFANLSKAVEALRAYFMANQLPCPKNDRQFYTQLERHPLPASWIKCDG